MSTDKIAKVVLAVATVGWIKFYGDYKYYSGKCDANKTWQKIVDAQNNLMEDLFRKLKEKEAS